MSFYDWEGARVPVRRIYNRAIVDEILTKQIQLPFRFDEPLNVEVGGAPQLVFCNQ